LPSHGAPTISNPGMSRSCSATRPRAPGKFRIERAGAAPGDPQPKAEIRDDRHRDRAQRGQHKRPGPMHQKLDAGVFESADDLG